MAEPYELIGALRKRPQMQVLGEGLFDSQPISAVAQRTAPMSLKEAAISSGLSGNTAKALDRWFIDTDGERPLSHFLQGARAPSQNQAMQQMNGQILSEEPNIQAAWQAFNQQQVVNALRQPQEAPDMTTVPKAKKVKQL